MHTTQQKKAKNGKASAQRAPQPSMTPDAARKMPAYARRAVQTKVAVGPAGDSFEQEADSVAQRVRSGQDVAPDSLSSVSGQKPQKAEDKKTGAKPEEQKPIQKAEEKKPVQKADEKKPETAPKPVQKAEEKKPEQTPKPVQKAEEKKPESTSKPVQKSEAKNAPGTGAQQADAHATEAAKDTAMPHNQDAMDEAAEQAIRLKGPGRPLNPATQQTLSERIGIALDHVRIHDGPEAQEACRALHARAFTHGSDIWLAAGESDTDIDLMAHEVTHVIQQADHVHRETIQRKASNSMASAENDSDEAQRNPQKNAPVQRASVVQAANPDGNKPASGASDTPSITVASIQTSIDTEDIESAKIPKFYRRAGYDRKKDPPLQSNVWDNSIDATKIATRLKTGALQMSDDDTYLILAKGRTLIGNATTLAAGLKRPFWNRAGSSKEYQVDHKVELVLTGYPKSDKGNALDNMQLLDKKSNQGAGNKISNTLNTLISDFITGKNKGNYPNRDEELDNIEKHPKLQKTLAKQKLSAEIIRSNVDLVFQTLKPDTSTTRESKYSKENIEAGHHITALEKPANSRDVKVYNITKPVKNELYSSPLPAGYSKKSLLGTEDTLVIYKHVGGGHRVEIDFSKLQGDTKTPTGEEKKKLGLFGFDVQKIKFNRQGGGNSAGEVRGDFFPKFKPYLLLNNLTDKGLNLVRVPNTDYAGYLQLPPLQMDVKKASPIRIDSSFLDDEKGVVVMGKVLPTIPFIDKLDLDLVIEGNDLRIERTFEAGEIKIPGPVKATGGSLTLAIGTESGFSISGKMELEIDRVGKGSIEGSASVDKGFELKGEFIFDPKLVEDARLEVWYKENEFGIGGKIHIKEGKVKGVKSGDIEVSYTKGKLSASGTAQLSVPGVKEAGLSLEYSDKDGMTITGTLQLAESKVIQSGSGKVTVSKKEGDEYHVSASGTAVPKIPGISASISFSVDDDAFTVEGSAGYEKGMLKGSILVGATNRPVGDDGKPAAGPPKKEVTVYGGGSVTLKLAPWLQATAGIKLLPNGEIEVVGKIGLPSSVNLFDEKKLEKNIFKINIDIPIIGISAAGQNVGIFATVGGGLDLSAGIGPGVLQDVGVEVTYNPDHEENTHIVGTAKIHIPAHAGLRLFVRGALGVGIPLVDARAGLEVGGSLGLEGALDAGVQVDWTPTKGLVIDAKGEAYVEPKLKFDIKAFVEVELDLLLKTITLYENSWDLASFEWGSGLRFGVEFPIHYEEGKAFNVSMDDLKFKVPDIQPMEVLSGLVKKIID